MLMVILAGVVISAVCAQQPSSPQSGRRLAVECDHAAPPAGMHWVCNDRNDPCNCRLESDRPGGGMLDGEGEPEAARISSAGFEQMMNTLAAARSGGNVDKAVELFTADAVGSNLTTGQTYRGRAAAAAKLFAGGKSAGQAATVQWHHLLFDEKDQIGAGEFTLEGNPRHHGVLMVKLENGKIARWREYRIASSRNWERFTAENPF
jgi:hypothetical protein